MESKVNLIGYWNGDDKDPEITFYVKESPEDTRKLVHIELSLIPEQQSANKARKDLKRADKALKKLIKSIKN